MKLIAALTIAFLGVQSPADAQPAGVIDVFEFDADYGALERAASAVPRVMPNAAAEAREVWRASAERFAARFAASRGGAGSESFAVRLVYEDEIGQAHVRLTQTLGGVPVTGTELIVHVDRTSGKVLGVNGRFAIDRGIAPEPGMAARDAVAAAVRESGLAAHVEDTPELRYVIDRYGNIRLAWSAQVAYIGHENGAEVDRIYADAHNGEAIARHPQIRRAMNRQIYDCNHKGQSWNDCTFIWGESCGFCWSKDATAAAAWSNAAKVYDYYRSKHNRPGMDAEGIVAFKQGIHWGDVNTTAAGWVPPVGPKIGVVYGDGVGSFSSPLPHSLDIVAHEFTHGVMRYEVGLPYEEEQGSIDEGFADIFAVLTTSFAKGISPDWKIADDIYTKSTALRYLNDPARQTLPTHADWYPLRKGGSDLHRNAGIVTLPFYLFSEGGFHPRRPTNSVGGWGAEAAGKVFYRALAAYMTSNTNFRTLRDYTSRAALDLYGSEARWNMEEGVAGSRELLGYTDVHRELVAQPGVHARRHDDRRA